MYCFTDFIKAAPIRGSSDCKFIIFNILFSTDAIFYI